MSSWNSASFKFSPFDGLKTPLKATLKVLKTVEAILEALLDLIKAFLIDIGNPIRALVALLLASVRAIINQLRSSGFSILLVHPDFGRQDFGSMLESVSGGYNAFESKVISKFNDTSDINRPNFPPGSAVAMIIFYIGVETPQDLMGQLMSLLKLIRHPIEFRALPAPVSLTVRPLFKSDAGVQQVATVASALVSATTGIVGGQKIVKKFTDNFSGNLDKKLVLEWRMPTSPQSGSQDFTNHLVSIHNSFAFPSFIVERSEKPTGETVLIKMKSSATSEKLLGPKLSKFKFPIPDTKVELKEPDGSIYKHFEKRVLIEKEIGLLEGDLTGTYRFVDDDPNLKPGATYYYRVRACFGSPTDYVKIKTADDVSNSRSLVRWEGNRFILNYGQDVALGTPSLIVKATIPREGSGPEDFNAQKDVFDAVKVGFLLNFELPPSGSGDTVDQIEQKAGWGSLSGAAGQVGAIKSIYKDSDRVKDNSIFSFSVRRIANSVASSANDKPQTVDMLSRMWRDGVSATVKTVLNAGFKWNLLGSTSAGTISKSKISAYLAKEASYKDSGTFDGPYPIKPRTYQGDIVHVTADERRKLGDFIRLCVASTGASTSYMSWYSVSLGDIFPALVPFIFDFEQFLLSLVKAMDSVIKEIEGIIQNILNKIRQLEQFLESIINLIDLFNIQASASVLTVTSTNGSTDDLVREIQQSENKPGNLPHGLYSGIVVVVGGSGSGSLQAIKAIGFVLGL